DPQQIEPALVDFYQRQSRNRRWRSGMVHVIRDTMNHCVRGRLPEVRQPTLLVSGREDRIVSPEAARSAAGLLPQGPFLTIPHCGNAPQIEKARLVTRLVVRSLSQGGPAPGPKGPGPASDRPGA